MDGNSGKKNKGKDYRYRGDDNQRGKAVRFCLTQAPVAMLLEQTDGYKMGKPGEETAKEHIFLFIDDLKVYQENHKKQEITNKFIIKANMDTGAVYGVKKCAEIVSKNGKTIKGEGLEVLEERIKALDSNQNEVYKILGCQQGQNIDVKKGDGESKKGDKNKIRKEPER